LSLVNSLFNNSISLDTESTFSIELYNKLIFVFGSGLFKRLFIVYLKSEDLVLLHSILVELEFRFWTDCYSFFISLLEYFFYFLLSFKLGLTVSYIEILVSNIGLETGLFD